MTADPAPGAAPVIDPAAQPVPAPDPAPQPAPAMDWRADWEPELRESPTLEKFKDSKSLAKSYESLEKMLGKNKVVIPGENATKEEIDAFHTQLGRPETADKYKFSVKESLPEGTQIPEEPMIRDWLHQAGTSQDQADLLFKMYMENRLNGEKVTQENKDKTLAEATVKLRAEYGLQYDAKLALAEKAYKAFEDADSAAFWKEHGNNPAMVRMFARVGESISDDKMLGGGVITSTPGQAQAEINTIIGDMSGPYHNRSHIEHDATVKRVNNLFKVVNAQKAT